jgi:hypothetical protein
MSPDTINKPNRVWINPAGEEGQPSVVCLTADALCLAVVPAADREKSATVLAEGGRVPSQTIPLAEVTQLQGEEGASDLSITYKKGKVTTDSVTVTLLDVSRRDDLLAALQDRLGPAWTCERRRVSRLSACRWPLGVTIGVVLLTWLMYGEAEALAAGRHPNVGGQKDVIRLLREAMLWVEGLIGSTGVLIVGGVLVSLSIGWLVYAVYRRPTRITVRTAMR